MADAADFIIRLIDKATAPAARIAAAMKSVDKALKPIRKSKAFDVLDRAGTKMFEAGKQAVFLGAALGAIGTAVVTGAIIKAADNAARVERSFSLLTGSATEGQRAFKVVNELVDDLGLNLGTTQKQFQKLLAQQFSIGEAEGLVKMVADLRTIGVEGEAANRVLIALTQIRAKGRVQQEELLQLAEAGISLKLVMEELGKATGKSLDEVRKMQEAGKIDDAIAFDAIRKAIKKKIGVDEFGDAGRAFANETLTGLVGRIRSAGSLLIQEIGKQANKSVDQLKPALKEFEQFVKDIEPEGFVEFASIVIGALPGVLRSIKEFAIGFGQEMEIFLMEFRGAFGKDGALEDARSFGRLFAKFMISIVKLVGFAADVFKFFTTPVGKTVAVLGGLAIVAVKVVAAVAAIAPVIGGLATAFASAGSLIQGTMFLIQMSLAKGLLAAIVAPIAAIGAVPLAIGAALAAAGVAIFVWVDDIKAFFAEFEGTLFGTAVDWGVALLDGLTFGLFSKIDDVIAATKAVGGRVIDAAKSALGIASPSKPFRAIGQNLMDSAGTGMQDRKPSLRSTAADSVGNAAIAGAASGARMAQGGGPNVGGITIPIEINGANDPEAVAQEVERRLPSAIALALETLTAPSPVAT